LRRRLGVRANWQVEPDDVPTYFASMTDTDFDTALVTTAFRLAGEDGWHRVNAAAAARAAGLPVAEARVRFPSRASILLRFGSMADQEALRDVPSDGSERDRLFDLLMRRFDFLQAHRAGVRALLRSLPTDPLTAMLLAVANARSMRWMLQAAGIDATGPRGDIQAHGLLAVWVWAVRAWDKDESEDLSGTMAAVDTGLQRAESFASMLAGSRMAPPPPPVNAGAGELDPSDSPPPAEPDPAVEPPSPPNQPSPPPASSGPVIPDPSV
jgi:ubiquinone biosynthesis protein COQ9